MMCCITPRLQCSTPLHCCALLLHYCALLPLLSALPFPLLQVMPLLLLAIGHFLLLIGVCWTNGCFVDGRRVVHRLVAHWIDWPLLGMVAASLNIG